jgi:uncharacterized protein YgiM (DUF1202 family)
LNLDNNNYSQSYHHQQQSYNNQYISQYRYTNNSNQAQTSPNSGNAFSKLVASKNQQRTEPSSSLVESDKATNENDFMYYFLNSFYILFVTIFYHYVMKNKSESLAKEFMNWHESGMWKYSCYSIRKSLICKEVLQDISFEEMRFAFYEANKANDMNTFVIY